MTFRLALIGCGAIAESFYLPALAKRKNLIRELILVDPDETQLDKLKAKYPVKVTLTDYRQIADQVDGAIIATPPSYHHEIVMAFVQAGVPVLCEKPLAETAYHVKEMAAAAKAKDVGILVNNTRRLFPNTNLVKEWITAGRLGPLKRIEYNEGQPFGWPTTSGFYFTSNKGVLMDRGSHVLDLLCWWLGEKPDLVSFRDDSFGGSEAVAQISLQLNGCHCKVRLSWLTKLANRFLVEGQQGILAGDIYDWRNLTFTDSSGRSRSVKARTNIHHMADFVQPLLDNFLAMIAKQDRPLIPAAEVKDSIQLIEECYARREPFDMPWMQPTIVKSHAE